MNAIETAKPGPTPTLLRLHPREQRLLNELVRGGDFQMSMFLYGDTPEAVRKLQELGLVKVWKKPVHFVEALTITEQGRAMARECQGAEMDSLCESDR
jgi:hypothetical protein